MSMITGDAPAAMPAPWFAGDFHVIGVEHTVVGERLVEDSGLSAGKSVLDVACGSGNMALAAARRHTHVTGIDMVPKLLERARARASADGLPIEFVEGRCEKLPFADESFDYVYSTFGVMFSVDPQRAAAEILRVCKPGGIIGMATWTPSSLPAQLTAVSLKYMPVQARPQVSPFDWAVVSGLQRFFGDRVAQLRLYDRVEYTRFESVEHWMDTFRTYFGPVKLLLESVAQQVRGDIEHEVRQVAEEHNRAADGTFIGAMHYVNAVMVRS